MKKKKFIIILDGPMGSGKSTIGEMLAKRLKRTAVINEDKIKWFISDFKRSKRDNAIVRAVFLEMAKEYPKHGINLVISQGFLKNFRSLDPFRAIAKKNSMRFLVYHLEASREVLLARINERKKKHNFAHPRIAESRIHRNLRNWKANRFSVGVDVRTDQMTPRQTVDLILKDLKNGG
jgi:shikimate kinase